ncbi:MAG: phosphohydrolase [Synergistales bacterium]|nr:phosphohydrolase [Synergistales bacterium]
MHAMQHVISHTDLDGVTAAAVAWHAHYPEEAPPRVSLLGYGEVDDRILQALQEGYSPLVLDLFCQRQETIDELDRRFGDAGEPFFFDHHKTTLERFGNRSWLVIDPGYCAAKVYHRWLLEHTSGAVRQRLVAMSDLVEVANDRDLWINERPESRLWQALVTMSGPWGVFARLAANPSSALLEPEYEQCTAFVTAQEERFARAREEVARTGELLDWVAPGLLEFGDVSDFGGLLLDRSDHPARLVAVANRRMKGDWAVSLRSRSGLAAKVVGILRDGKRIRGGGHGDAAAVYFPRNYRQEQIRESLLSAVRTLDEQDRPLGISIGDMLKSRES